MQATPKEIRHCRTPKLTYWNWYLITNLIIDKSPAMAGVQSRLALRELDVFPAHEPDKYAFA